MIPSPTKDEPSDAAALQARCVSFDETVGAMVTDHTSAAMLRSLDRVIQWEMRIMRRTILAAGTCACIFGASIVLAPMQVGTAFVGTALAKDGGGGNGNGGGNGGGNGHGGGEGHGNSGSHGNGSSSHGNSSHGNSSNAKSSHGNSSHPKSSHAKSSHSNFSHAKSSMAKGTDDHKHVHAVRETVDYANDDVYGLGALNAAHASPNARAHAAPNSSVGKIAAYERSRDAALAISDPVARADALDAAVARLEDDFGRALTDAQVDRVNDLLDAKSGMTTRTDDDEHAVRQTVDYDANDDGYGLGALNAAHASPNARAHAAPNSSVGKIAAYERSRDAALAISDPAARADALDDAVARLEDDFGRPLTDAQVDRVNDLLDARH
ncbi:hypothetical protein [Rhizobium sp. RAF56]|uniref:hypothetical protein n=1 Tax=Rhizobium sp. RAF56 TaxID=3233062 RepID=UPI003F947FD1